MEQSRKVGHPHRRLVIEELEERVMLSATPLVDLADVGDPTETDLAIEAELVQEAEAATDAEDAQPAAEAADAGDADADAQQTIQLFNASPALFVENQGQWTDETIDFGFRGAGANIAFRDGEIAFQVFQREPVVNDDASTDESIPDRPGDPASEPDYVTQMTGFTLTFEGANAVAPVGLDQAETVFNYFVTGEGMAHAENVTSYTCVAYVGLYDGIDLLTFGQRDSLKYEFHVAPSADPSQILLTYTGITGLSLDDAGALHVHTDLGDLIDPAPIIYQEIDGERIGVAGAFALVDSDTVSFTITGEWDPGTDLVIDPDLGWSTYLGGGIDDSGDGIAVDGSGNVLVTGGTGSSGWVSGGWDTTHNGDGDAYVVKLAPTGGHLWSTYLGGNGSDWGCGIALDSSGNVLLTGCTYSSGWVSGGWDTTHNGDNDAFVVKLAPTGGHLWSTYLGGSGSEHSYDNGIAVDGSGNVLVAGRTYSSGWVSGGWDTTLGGFGDAFVVKLAPTGGHLWSTYLGGNGFEECGEIALDGSGNVLVTGYTESSGWVSGGWDTTYNGGTRDAFVVKLAPTGGHLWSTYLGGSSFEYDLGAGIAVDGSGNVLVTGGTGSSGWVSGGWDTTHNGPEDAYVVKLAPTGGHLWSTYLGGSGYDWGCGIALDGSGNVLVTGGTESSGWVSGGWDTTYNGGTRDAFVVKLAPTGGHLWSTYLGGSDSDSGTGITADAAGNVLVTGYTYSSGWVSGGWDTTHNGGGDAFVARITEGPANASPDLDLIAPASHVTVPTGSPVSVAWTDSDPDDDASISLAFDPDTGATPWEGPANHTWITTSLTEDPDGGGDQHSWDTTGVPAGTYSVWAVISDGTNPPVYSRAPGLVTVAPADDWTIMVFMNGDNNLEGATIDDVNEMEMPALSEAVNVVVLLDRIDGWASTPIPDGGTEWTDTRWGLITHDDDTSAVSTVFTPFVTPPGDSELNMGDASVLEDFAVWARVNYPAQHYALILWDHGSGWPHCSNDSTDGDELTMPDLRVALDSIGHVDLLGFDMCLMGMVEVATEAIGHADYVVASEDLEPFYGWDYDEFLDLLVLDSGTGAEDLAKEIVATYDGSTLAALRLADLPALNDEIETFASLVLDSGTSTDWGRLQQNRSSAESFHFDYYRDLSQYMQAVSEDTEVASGIRDAAQNVVAAVQGVVLPGFVGGTGLSVYLPALGNNVDPGYNSTSLTFCDPQVDDGSHWGEFLGGFPEPGWFASWLADWGELITDARTIEALPGQRAMIDSRVEAPDDVDFMRLTATGGHVLYAETFGDAVEGGLVPTLTIYAPDQETVLAQVAGTPAGLAQIALLALEEDGEYYLAITSEGNLDPLSPTVGTTSGQYTICLLVGDPSGLGPHISADTLFLDFGQVELGTAGEVAAHLANEGNIALTVTALTLPDGSPFVAPSQPIQVPFALGPGAVAELPIGFGPDGLGMTSHTLRVTSTDPATPEIEIILNGEGVDTTAPTALLAAPLDGGFGDSDPDGKEVLVAAVQGSFAVQLEDGTGSGIDDTTVTAATIFLAKGGSPLTEGVDYDFSYDTDTDRITLTAIGGDFGDGTYEIAVSEAGLSIIADLAGNPIIDPVFTVVIDTVAPVVTVDSRFTNDTTPELTGTVDDTTAAVDVTVSGTEYAATNNGDGTWTLVDDTIVPALGDGVYRVTVTATDPAGNVGADGTTDELEVDTVPPVVTVDQLLTNDATPELTGTVDDADASVDVTVDGTGYDATNNGDGTWALTDGTITPALSDGTYDVAVTATDLATNVGSDATADELIVDSVSPAAGLATPMDNGPSDHAPDPKLVIVSDAQSIFVIELEDSTGTGIDDGTVVSGTIRLSRNGTPLTRGADYTFSYDSGDDEITLTPIGGDFSDGVYELAVSEPGLSIITDLAGNPIVAPVFTVTIDTTAATASLSVPLDNGPGDLDPDPKQVFVDAPQPNFTVALDDGSGVGVDDSTVTAGAVLVTKDGVPLTEGAEYAFSYAANLDEITLTPVGGDFEFGIYEIAVSEPGLDTILDLAGNPLEDPVFTVTIPPWLVVVDQANPFLFVDADGDTVDLSVIGAGQMTVTGTQNEVAGSDIQAVFAVGGTGGTEFLVEATGGGNGAQVGIFAVGSVFDTVLVDGDVNELDVAGHIASTVEIAGALGEGSVAADVRGNLIFGALNGDLRIGDDVESSGRVTIRTLAEHGAVRIGDDLKGQVRVLGDAEGTIEVGDLASGLVWVMGDMSGLIEAGTDLNNVRISGTLEGVVAAHDDIIRLRVGSIDGGAVMAGFDYDPDLGTFTPTGYAGDVRRLELTSSSITDSVIAASNDLFYYGGRPRRLAADGDDVITGSVFTAGFGPGLDGVFGTEDDVVLNSDGRIGNIGSASNRFASIDGSFFATGRMYDFNSAGQLGLPGDMIWSMRYIDDLRVGGTLGGTVAAGRSIDSILADLITSPLISAGYAPGVDGEFTWGGDDVLSGMQGDIRRVISTGDITANFRASRDILSIRSGGILGTSILGDDWIFAGDDILGLWSVGDLGARVSAGTLSGTGVIRRIEVNEPDDLGGPDPTILDTVFANLRIDVVRVEGVVPIDDRFTGVMPDVVVLDSDGDGE